MREETLPLNTSEQFTLFDLDTPSGRTSPASYQPQTMLSAASSLPLSALMKPLKLRNRGPVRAWSADPRDLPPGVFWTLNSSAWPNDASVCSLSSVLETGPIPQRYFLSARACSGILRRAAKRGKELPEALRHALAAVAGLEPTSTVRGGLQPVEVSPTIRAGGNRTGGDRPPGTDVDTADSLVVTHALRADGFDASEDGTGRGTPLVPMAFSNRMGATDEVTETLRSGCHGALPMVAQAIPIQEVGKRTGASTGDPRAGIGIGNEGDPMYTLQAGAQHGVLAFSSKDHGADAEDDLSPTLRAGGHAESHANAGVPPAIAFNLRGRDGGAMPEVTDVASLREMREAGRERRPPPGWKSPKQRARELDAYLSKLPQQGASPAEAVPDLREASEGPGLLQQASATAEETRRSTDGQDSPEEEVLALRPCQQCAGPMWAALYGSQEARIATGQGGQGLVGVRRLTPL